MSPSRRARRRPSTPNLMPRKQEATQDHHLPLRQADHIATVPTSPPETPTTSPPLSRKLSLKPRHQQPYLGHTGSVSRDSAIRPFGNGHQFSYRPSIGPEQLSPRSSTSSDRSEDLQESADDESSDSDSNDGASRHAESDDHEGTGDDSGDGSDSDSDNSPSQVDGSRPERADPPVRFRIVTMTTVECDFVIEDIDPMDSGCEGLDVLHPTEIESIRSRSRSRSHRGNLDRGMMQNLRNLHCSNEPSDNDDDEAQGDEDLEYDDEPFLKRQQELRHFRRLSTTSSLTKRTHSELSGDSDNEGGAGLDFNDAGFSARRMRKRLHRGSILFQDPPAPRIDELEEPPSSDDDIIEDVSGVDLLRELPYWTNFIMETNEAESS